MTHSRAEELVDSFSEQLKQALEHFAQPGWLGERSPLAMPYFLGNYLRSKPQVESALGRGKALQQLLREVAAELGLEPEGRSAQRLLELSFFQDLPLHEILNTLGVARATYYRHLSKALQRLADALIRRASPALRLEVPLAEHALIGRREELELAQRALRQRQTVVLIGPGGSGKTVLGSAIAHQMAPQPVFWWTLRVGLNDLLSSLLFSLGYFLHSHGASSLWLQLVADAGSLDPKILLGLVRHELAQLQPQPLLCFDQFDLLRPNETEEHARILGFLESLHGEVALLVLGERPAFEIDLLITLDKLSPEAAVTLLEQASITLSEHELARLYEYTGGNPRLLRLCASLYQSGEERGDLLQRLVLTPSLEALVGRIWPRLGQEEQLLLQVLAVFRRPAPADAWEHRQALDKLQAQDLVRRDAGGGVALVPALATVIRTRLSAEMREQCHLLAADIRGAHGEYTAAAYHYISAGRLSLAIWLWYHHRSQEIAQGQAAAALALFSQISQHQLQERDREVLVLLRSELRLLAGEYDQVRADLEAVPWPADRLSSLRAKRLLGDIAVRQGRLEQALQAYRQGLELDGALLSSERARFHKALGQVYERQRDLSLAWREACLARYEAQDLQGYIQSELANYAVAQDYYSEALALAEELNHAQGVALTCDHMAQLFARQGNLARAAEYWERALRQYTQSGNISFLARIKANQAGWYNTLGQTQQAIASGLEALALFERLGETHGKAHAAHNLAEAYKDTGDFASAAEYARLALHEQEAGIRPYSLLTLAEISLAQEQLKQAETFCLQSLAAVENTDPRLSAYAWRALSQIYTAMGATDQAREALLKARELFQSLGIIDEELPAERDAREQGPGYLRT